MAVEEKRNINEDFGNRLREIIEKRKKKQDRIFGLWQRIWMCRLVSCQIGKTEIRPHEGILLRSLPSILVYQRITFWV